jgi:hypothetical protein
MSAAAIVERLRGTRRTGDGRWIAKCPAHEDRRASLSIRELGDGRVLVHCFTGCQVEAILAAVDLEFEALFPPRSIERAAGVRPAVPASDVLRAIVDELDVVMVVAGDLAQGRLVSETDFARLRLARERIGAAREVALGS